MSSTFFPSFRSNNKNKNTASKVVKSKDIEKGSYLFTGLDSSTFDPEIQKVKSPSVILTPEEIKLRESSANNHTDNNHTNPLNKSKSSNTPTSGSSQRESLDLTPAVSVIPPIIHAPPATPASPIVLPASNNNKFSYNNSLEESANDNSDVPVYPGYDDMGENISNNETNNVMIRHSEDIVEYTNSSTDSPVVANNANRNFDENSLSGVGSAGKKRIRATRPGQNKNIQSSDGDPTGNNVEVPPKLNETSKIKNIHKEETQNNNLSHSLPAQSTHLESQDHHHRSFPENHLHLDIKEQPNNIVNTNKEMISPKPYVPSIPAEKLIIKNASSPKILNNQEQPSSPIHPPQHSQPSQPPQPTIEARLHKIEENLSQWQTKLEHIVNSQDKLLVTKRDYFYKLIQICKKQKKMEHRQREMLEAENFDEAQSIAEQIENLKAETKQDLNQIIDTSREWINLEGDRGQLFSTLSQVRTTVLANLKQLETEQTTKLEEIKRKVTEENQRNEYSFGKAIQRIERELLHSKSDIESLEAKAQKIEHIIQERTASQRIERNNLMTKKNSLVDNRTKLLTRIDSLEQDERQCDKRLESLDKDITALKDKYKPDTEKISISRTALERSQAKLLSEQMAVNKDMDYYNSKINHLQNDCQKHETLLGLIENSISNFRITIKLYNQITMESHENRLQEENYIEEQTQEEGEIYRIQKTSSDLSNRIKEIPAQINTIRNEIRSVEQLINNLTNTTLPNLENDKKIVVKGKDYRKAKEMQQQITEVQQEIEDLNKKKKQLEDSLSVSLLQLDSTQNDYDQKEFELKQKIKYRDQIRIEKHLLRIKNLQIQLRSSQSNPNTPPHQLKTIEIKLMIERSQISHICLTYDTPYPTEYSLDAPDPEPMQRSLLGIHETIDHLSEEVEEEEEVEGSLFGDLMVDEEPLDHMMPSDTSYKSPEELEEDKNQEFERLKKILIQLETDLDNAVQVEDFNLADTINSQITEINQRISELEYWISQNNINE